MKDETFHRLIRELRPFLRVYLEEKNVEIDERNFMRCINPDHEDRTPSMHFMGSTDDTVVHCFGCGASYNIFQAASIYDGWEVDGVGFIKEMLPNLAKKYKIHFDADDLELSEEAVVEYRYRQLYRDAFQTLQELGTYEHTRERGWQDDTCKSLGVASVNWDVFEERLKHKGQYTSEEIMSKNIHRQLFGHHLITFTIFDHKNRPSGFVARNVNYDHANKATYPKYRNTSNDVPIYNKSEIIYGLQSTTRNTHKRLDIFEGYADWVTSQHYNHDCAAALGGVALTPQHLELVKNLGFSHINIILDGDLTGDNKTTLYLDKYAGKIEGLKMTVITLPFDDDVEPNQRDPDNYFKANGLENFMKIEPMSSFDWRMKKFIQAIKKKYLDTGMELEELKANFKTIAADDLKSLVDKMIPMIMAEPSPIEQGRMCTVLARYTGAIEADIRDEVTARSNRRIADIAKYTQNQLRNADDSVKIQQILSDAAKKVEEATSSRDTSAYHHMEILEHLDSFFYSSDNPVDELTGWRTGWPMFDDPVVMGGIPKKDSILTFAGSPNHGKSAVLMNLAKQLLINENKGLSVLMWYLDDPRNIAWAKMLASMSCESILDVRRPDRRIYCDDDRKNRFLGWRDFLRHSVHTKKFLVKGHDIGNDTGSLEYWIKHTQDTTGNDVVVFVDAVHDMITKTQSDNDERIKFARIYDWVQATTETLEYTFATCAHITKVGMAKGKPDQADLSETGKIIFASKVIGMVYSELDYLTSVHRRNDAMRYWVDEKEIDNVDRRKPIVEMNITKNKEAQFKGTMFFKHKSDACYLEPMTSQEVEIMENLNKEEPEHGQNEPNRPLIERKYDNENLNFDEGNNENPIINPQPVEDIESSTV